MFKSFAIAALTLAFADARSERELKNKDKVRACEDACTAVTEDVTRYAVCNVTDPTTSFGTTGTVEFTQTRTTTRWVKKNDPSEDCQLWACTPDNEDGLINVDADVSSLSPGKHGFHVHKWGTLDTGCGGASGHYNPTGVDHNAYNEVPRHDGDLQMLTADANGDALLNYNDAQATLFGDRSIQGRAIVIHAGVDDLGDGGDAGSLANGNAGPRVGCCVIVASDVL